MAGGTSSQFTDERQLRAVIDAAAQEISSLKNDDVLIDLNRRLILRSPNGHFWNVAVSDAGALTVTDMGTTL